jgi:chromosome segregation ATPase
MKIGEPNQYRGGEPFKCQRCEAWKTKLEQAEAELSTKSLQCERHKKARYQIELECMKLTKENYDLQAEVERLRGKAQAWADHIEYNWGNATRLAVEDMKKEAKAEGGE